MSPLSKLKLSLLLVPVALLGVVMFTVKRRPMPLGDIHDPTPLPGRTGPAGISGPAVAFAFSSSGDLYCASLNGNVQKYLPERKAFRSLTPLVASPPGSDYHLQGFPLRLFFTTSGNEILAPCSNREMPALTQVIDTDTRLATGTLPAPQTSAVDFSADGKWAVMGMNNGFFLLDMSKIKPVPKDSKDSRFPKLAPPVATFYKTTMPVDCADFAPNSHILAVTYNHQIALFDLKQSLTTPVRVRTFDGYPIGRPNPATASSSNGTWDSINNDDPAWLEWSPTGTKFGFLTSRHIALFDDQLKPIAVTELPRTGDLNYGSSPIPGQPLFMGANLAWNRFGLTLLSGGSLVRRWDGTNLKLEKEFAVSGPVALSPDENNMVTMKETKPGDYPSVELWKIG